MVSLENAESVLKSVYLSAITELLNTKVNPLMSKIQQTTNDVWGKDIRRVVKAGINGGIGAGDEAGDLPKTGDTNYLLFESSLKNLYGQIEISDKAIRATNAGRGAFVDLLNNELEGLLTASRFNLSRMLYGDGTGLLCTMLNATTCDSDRFMIEGMMVDVYRGSSLVYSAKRVVSIKRPNIITLEDGVTLQANDKLYLQGSKDKEITGLGAIFNTGGTIYGVDKSIHQYLEPVSITAMGYTEKTLEETIDKIEINSCGNVDFIACGKDVKYSYQEYLNKYRRNVDMMELGSGFKTMSYNGIPLVYDRFAENDCLYLLDTSAFKLHQLCDWRYLENENGKILRQTQGRPTFTATLVKYCDLICERPQGQGKIRGLFSEE